MKGYSWDFRSILKYYTIEFCKHPASKTANEVLGDVVCSDVHKVRLAGEVESDPTNCWVLRWFLRQNHVARLNEPGRLEWIWTGKDPNAFVEGMPLEYVDDLAGTARVRRMIE